MAFTDTMQNPFRSDAAQGMTNSLAEMHGHQFALQFSVDADGEAKGQQIFTGWLIETILEPITSSTK
jgi:hypothetical protein